MITVEEPKPELLYAENLLKSLFLFTNIINQGNHSQLTGVMITIFVISFVTYILYVRYIRI